VEFLVEFIVVVPEGTPESEIRERRDAEAVAAAELVADGHLVRLWQLPPAPGETGVLGLYRAESERQLRELLEALPLYAWMTVAIRPLSVHPSDPALACQALR
jgi:muconolactone delta-isomerase